MQKSFTTEECTSGTFISPGIVPNWVALKSQVGHIQVCCYCYEGFGQQKLNRTLTGRGAVLLCSRCSKNKINLKCRWMQVQVNAPELTLQPLASAAPPHQEQHSTPHPFLYIPLTLNQKHHHTCSAFCATISPQQAAVSCCNPESLQVFLIISFSFTLFGGAQGGGDERINLQPKLLRSEEDTPVWIAFTT